VSSRNIAVQKGVYDRLVQEKRAGESFTELFRRLLDQKVGVDEVAGAWGRAQAPKDRRRLRAIRSGGKGT